MAKDKKKNIPIVNNKFLNIAILVFNICTALLFAFITYRTVFNNNRSIIVLKPIYVIIGCILYTILIYLLYRIINKFIKKKKTYIIILFAILTIIQIIFIIIFKVKPGQSWDFGTIFNCAKDFVDGIAPLNSQKYLYRYNNNIGIALLLSLFFFISKLFHYTNYINVGYIINLLAINISLLYACKIICMIFEEKYQKIFILLLVIFSPFVTYTPIIYTDTIGMFFATMACYHIIRYYIHKDNKNLIYAAIMIGIGINIKFTIIIILIAYLLFYVVCEKIDLKGLKRILLFTAICFIPFFILKIYVNLDFDSKRLNNSSFPATHWINMGLHGYGGYDPEVVTKTASQKTKKEKAEYNKKEIFKNIKQYMKKHQLIDFYGNKLIYIWGDGQYYIIQKLSREPINNYSIKDYVLNDEKNKKFELYCQTQHVLLLISLVVGILFRKYLDDKQKKLQLFLNLCIIGLTLFLLLWEARSRYLIHYLPIIILSGYIGITACISFIKKEVLKYEN